MPSLPLIFTDLETTGLDSNAHEIVEMALLRVDAETLEIEDEWQAKVKPEHIGTADLESLKISGYKEEGWGDALPLEAAVNEYAKRAQGGVLCAFTLYMDWSFLERAFVKTGIASEKYGVKGPFADYHFLDVLSFAYFKLRGEIPLERMTLRNVCDHLSIELKEHHRALPDARAAYEIYKKLVVG